MTRSVALWKLPRNSVWFKDVAESTFAQRSFSPHPLRQRFDRTFTTKTPSEPFLLRSICRHILVLDNDLTRHLLGFMPKSISSNIGMSCDPLPPLDGVSTYDSQFFSGTEDVFANRPRTRRQRENEERLLARMIPDQTLRAQLQVCKIHFLNIDNAKLITSHLMRLSMTITRCYGGVFPEESSNSLKLQCRCLRICLMTYYSCNSWE